MQGFFFFPIIWTIGICHNEIIELFLSQKKKKKITELFSFLSFKNNIIYHNPSNLGCFIDFIAENAKVIVNFIT